MPDRWNWKALDGLERRLTNLEEEVDSLATHVREDVRDLRLEMRGRFDSVDRDHKHAAKKLDDVQKVNWKSVGATLLAVATGIGAPIAVAFILAPQ